MEEALGPFHVPQHSRRVKLRVTPPISSTHDLDFHGYFLSPAADHPQHFSSGEVIGASSAAGSDAFTEANSGCVGGGGLNLSLSGGQRCGRSAVSLATAPVGPFTGYASILSRSRYLRPAEELLEGFCGVNRAAVGDLGAEKARVLEGSVGENWSEKVADRCGDSNLISLLHEVYKRYKLYYQQMQSAVSSFEAVAGLGNAAPFICYAIKAVSRHFHCLKKAILDHINFTSMGSGSYDFRCSRASSGFSSVDRGQKPDQHLQHRASAQHPVWRSQRGFPEKAVSVLRTWLFENFLHPYPTDTDKEMLARRTGLSRNQVSNWFTNARVRLWKPMVEEIHMLEKQGHFSSETEHREFVNVLADHFSPRPSSKTPQIAWIQKAQDDENKHIKASFPHSTGQASGAQQPDHPIGPNEPNGPGDVGPMGLSWSPCSQALPFWLAK